MFPNRLGDKDISDGEIDKKDISDGVSEEDVSSIKNFDINETNDATSNICNGLHTPLRAADVGGNTHGITLMLFIRNRF